MTWLSLIVLVSLARATLAISYRHSPASNHSTAHFRLLQLRFGVLIAGLIWGSAGFLMYPTNDPQHQMFLIFMLAGLSAGGVISFSADLISAILYSVSVLVPLLFHLFIQGNSLSLAMVMAGLMYLFFLIISSRYIHYNLYENIILRIEAVEREKLANSRTSELKLHNHTLSQINKRVALPTILDDLARYVEAQHPGMICSILLLDTDGKTLRNGAAPNLPDYYNKAIDGLIIGNGVGSCGTSAFLGELVVVENIQQHPYWAAYKELAQKVGLQSCWSQPFKSKDGRVLGTFAIYHRHPAQPTEDELTLITRYANLAQLSIENNHAQNELRISAIAFETQEGMLVTDANRVILQVNSAFTNITGYSEEDVIGLQPGMLSPDQCRTDYYAEMWESIRNIGNWEGEISNRRKSGEIYPEHLIVTAVKNLDGVVTNYVATLTDITKSKAAAEEIQSLAFYDPLTNLPNRRLLLDRLKHALATSVRSGRDGAILFLDLDHFKSLNDSLGHDIGDLLLIQVAERLTACLREGDTVARLGGDEYLVLLEDLSEQSIEAASQAEIIGEKILTALNQPYQLDANIYQSTVSIGVTLFSNHEESQEELLKHADIAMYQAKKSGRNNMCFFDPKMQDTINTRLQLERELRQALEKQQFKLYYQVQVDHLGYALGAEALIRWFHPERGMISPFHFIPLAEETGLILPIGQWVLNTACAQIQAWQIDKSTKDLTLSINISAKQFRQVDFVNQIQNAVQSHAINPKLLKLELTESILVDSLEDTIITMNSLKDIGIRFSLDDFGTGYSSLQYLKRLPLYQLKIDQSFVRDIVADSSDKAIVRTIIAMAHSLELEVIAEGVETNEQQKLLISKGCVNFQGYFFGKPMPIEQFGASLKKEMPTVDWTPKTVKHLRIIS